MRKYSSTYLLPAIVCLALATGLSSGRPAAADVQDLRVTRVVDGDTFELSDGQLVRLIGIDTPESHYSYKLVNDSERSSQDSEVIRKYGILASNYASSLALGKRVQLVFDDSHIGTEHKDRFGRTLAYINILDEAGNALYCLNDRLIFDGVANAYVKYPFSRMEWFRAAERIARTEERGFWSSSFDPDKELNHKDSDTVLYITKTGTKYHRSHCRSLRQSKIELHTADLGGSEHKYEACRICKPPAL